MTIYDLVSRELIDGKPKNYAEISQVITGYHQYYVTSILQNERMLEICDKYVPLLFDFMDRNKVITYEEMRDLYKIVSLLLTNWKTLDLYTEVILSAPKNFMEKYANNYSSFVLAMRQLDIMGRPNLGKYIATYLTKENMNKWSVYLSKENKIFDKYFSVVSC